MKTGIAVVGSIYADIIYNINGYPKIGELTMLEGETKKTTGGSVSNVAMDLANMDSELVVKAMALVGEDELGEFVIERFRKHPSINIDGINKKGSTACTIVMSDLITKQRTFFCSKGANVDFDLDEKDLENLDVKIFHLAYLLVLDKLDQKDEQYGTKAARILAKVKELGMETSIDLVSADSENLQDIVHPSLKYTDYCIINEIEAERTTGIALRDEKDALIEDNIKKALVCLKELGVAKWAVIHCPEGGFGVDENDNYYEDWSIDVPKGFIKGKVGAGDAFCAGILFAAHRALDLREALKIASAVATCSLSVEDSTDGVLSYEECLKVYNDLISKK